MRPFDRYAEIWVIDFEFNQNGRKGNPQNPVCCVAQELHSARVVRLWGREMDNPPFDLSRENVLTVGFYFSAESGCMAVRRADCGHSLRSAPGAALRSLRTKPARDFLFGAKTDPFHIWHSQIV